jgi:hypothetical protein
MFRMVCAVGSKNSCVDRNGPPAGGVKERKHLHWNWDREVYHLKAYQTCAMERRHWVEIDKRERGTDSCNEKWTW